MRPSPLSLLLILALALLTACGETPGDILPDPRDGRSGIQLSGLLSDRQVAISDGLPVLNTTDCDINEGQDRDVCVVTEDISGEQIRIIFENPDVLQAGAVLPVGSDCATAADCDAVLDRAVIEFAFGTDAPVRAVSGTLRIDLADPGLNYRGDFDVRLPNGSLNATFDLIPRPDELS